MSKSGTIGVDEVGRGCLAGPVVAAAVFVPQGLDLSSLAKNDGIKIGDSKTISPTRRQQTVDWLESRDDLKISWVEVAPAQIDEMNILQASLQAMRLAILGLQPFDMVGEIRVDGNQCPYRKAAATIEDISIDPSQKLQMIKRVRLIIKGDSKDIAIGAASIVAKVYRDQLMQSLHNQYPHYGWDRNMGYPAPKHLQGLSTHGITPSHRMSFAPVKKIIDSMRLDLSP